MKVGSGTLDVILPDGVDDPSRPSGGNVYDRRLCTGLKRAGWPLREHHVGGSWPHPTAAAVTALARVIGSLGDGSTVLVDGLIASAVPEVLVPAAQRLRLVVLVHLPLGEDLSAPAVSEGADRKELPVRSEQERAVLSAASAVIVTSDWTRKQLVDRYALPAQGVHVAEPGAAPAPLAAGTASGRRLLCVASVSPPKGHDVLVAALTQLKHLSWRCDCVGALDRDLAFVHRVRDQVDAYGLHDRVAFLGPCTGGALERAYATSDALVLASHAETYGMVVTEALARGLPVVATAVGGLPQALGRTRDGRRPGLLVPPGDPNALAVALRRWLGDPKLREVLRLAARDRRTSLSNWSVTSDRVAGVLRQVAA